MCAKVRIPRFSPSLNNPKLAAPEAAADRRPTASAAGRLLFNATARQRNCGERRVTSWSHYEFQLDLALTPPRCHRVSVVVRPSFPDCFAFFRLAARRNLVPSGAPHPMTSPAKNSLCLVHLSDLHLTADHSASRCEWFQRNGGCGCHLPQAVDRRCLLDDDRLPPVVVGFRRRRGGWPKSLGLGALILRTARPLQRASHPRRRRNRYPRFTDSGPPRPH